MTFESFFKASSYATVACGAAALAVSGGVGPLLGLAFAAALALAWTLEGKRWQLPERAGLLVVLGSLPLFYLDWKYQESVAGGVGAGVAALVHLTLFLCAAKLAQIKTDRDWLFLYLISFFEVLLAAGLSMSLRFVAALGVYLFFALLSVILFELRRAKRLAPEFGGRTRVTYAAEGRREREQRRGGDVQERGLRRIPLAAVFLLALVFALAAPIFFITPRFGGRPVSLAAGGGSSGYVGFSDRVTLGDIGRLQQSDQLVMRVRVEGEGASRAKDLRWRGLSLDNFDGRTWRRSSNESLILMGGERDFFQLGTTENLGRLTTQTFFVEPIDTAILFAAPRVVAVEGTLHHVRRYADGGTLITLPHPKELISYRAYSDTFEPPAETLRADMRRYPREKTQNLQVSIENYLQLPPETDARVGDLARRIIKEAGARNRYDAARAIEAHLSRNAYGGEYVYSLEMRAGGEEPLADFLFNVRAGHCEYYASAMAVMLRSIGVAARVVNGFQTGEYNRSASAYFVRQYDAHSWVEVYFPETDSWVTFDPTPLDGRPGGVGNTGLRASLQRYAEALELFWIQYVVAYDKQEQRSIANSISNGFSLIQKGVVRLANGLGARLSALLTGLAPGDGKSAGLFYAQMFVAVLTAGFLLLLIFKRGFRLARGRKAAAKNSGITVVEFYERMSRALAARGILRAEHQTPLEFAGATGVPEAVPITEAYHRVRYGAQALTPAEAAEIENCLRRIEEKAVNRES